MGRKVVGPESKVKVHRRRCQLKFFSMGLTLCLILKQLDSVCNNYNWKKNLVAFKILSDVTPFTHPKKPTSEIHMFVQERGNTEGI